MRCRSDFGTEPFQTTIVEKRREIDIWRDFIIINYFFSSFQVSIDTPVDCPFNGRCAMGNLFFPDGKV